QTTSSPHHILYKSRFLLSFPKGSRNDPTWFEARPHRTFPGTTRKSVPPRCCNTFPLNSQLPTSRYSVPYSSAATSVIGTFRKNNSARASSSSLYRLLMFQPPNAKPTLECRNFRSSSPIRSYWGSPTTPRTVTAIIGNLP